ncbi:MAG: amidohydrolase family protein [Planctomycetota bacterium]
MNKLLTLILTLGVLLVAAPQVSAYAMPQDPPPAPEPPEEIEEEEEPVEEVVEEIVEEPQEPVEETPEEEVVEEVVEEEEPVEDPNAVDPNSPYLAIYGADIHTVTDGLIRRGTILVKDGRILKLGTRVRIPKGARRIDAKGMQIYPGLVAVDSSGIVRGRGTSVRDDFDPYALNVDLGLAGGLTMVQSGGALAKLKRGTLDGVLIGETGWVNLSYSTTSPGGRRKLREEFAKVRQFLRDHRSWSLDQELGEDAGEEPEAKGINKTYLALLKGEATARFSANSLKDLLATCDLLEEYPMQSVIVGGREAWACAGRLGRVGAQLIITPRSKSWQDDDVNRPSGWTIENARILWEHGVPFAILPNERWISTGGIAGRDLLTLPMEAAFAIRGGLPQKVALRAVTIDAAKMLGVDHRLGSIEVGKDADLIICDGDLFHYRTFVQWSVVDGTVVYDKMKAPYFAHIRPREAASMEEVLEEIERAVDGAEMLEEEHAESVEEHAVDAPEVE